MSFIKTIKCVTEDLVDFSEVLLDDFESLNFNENKLTKLDLSGKNHTISKTISLRSNLISNLVVSFCCYIIYNYKIFFKKLNGFYLKPK